MKEQVGQKCASFCWSCSFLFPCFVPHLCVLWEGMLESLRTPSQCHEILSSVSLPLTCPEHHLPAVGMKGAPAVVLGSLWRVQLCLYTCTPSQCCRFVWVLKFACTDARSGEVFGAVGGAGDPAVGHWGLTGVQSSFRILPHPLQQHGQLSLGYKRLSFQSGKTMVVSPVAWQRASQAQFLNFVQALTLL